MINKTILVTGGAGFIGWNLCEELLEASHEVVCLDDFSTGKFENIGHLLDHKNFRLIVGVRCKMKKLLKSILGDKLRQSVRKVSKYFFPLLYLPEESKEDIDRRQKFYSQFVNPNDLVFDVGANVGNRTRPLLNIGTKIVAIEPQKECQEILKKKFGNKIEIVPMGLGETEEFKDFFISNAHTISSFSTEWIESVKEGRFKEYTWAEPIKIQRAIDCVSQIEKYNSEIECNFSKVESMEFALKNWQSATDFKKITYLHKNLLLLVLEIYI